MLREAKPDCVHVCLPHYLHYPVSKYFAEPGVNVFCEKPVALNTAQAKEFAALETAHPEVHIGICLQNLSLIHILENIRTTMETRIAAMQADNGKRLDEMRHTVDEKLQKTLDEKLQQS